MFEEAQLYSPVTTGDDGEVTVHLGDDHPGVNDAAYRERRNAIAAAALAWDPGEPIPRIEYTDAEQEVWRTVCRELAPKHERYACRAFREALVALDLPQRPDPAARRGQRGAARRSPASSTCRPPGSSRSRSSTARSPTAASTRPSTCATTTRRSTRPSPT